MKYIFNKYFFISIAFVLTFMAIGYSATHSYFSDSAISNANTFSAASVFPTIPPSITPTLTPSITPTPGVQPGDVVINEIMWMGSQGNAADEWIELRNMTSNTIDLSNWVVDNLGSGVTNNIVIPSGKNISPNGYFLITNNSAATSAISIAPDHQTNISLLNPSETLILRTAAGGTIIDSADNDANGWFAGQDGNPTNPEKSMERNTTPGVGTVSTNWHTATSSTNMDVGAREIATPKAVNSAP